MDKGGFIISFEPERSASFKQLALDGKEFSLELSSLDWQSKSKEFFLIIFEYESNKISAAALVERKKGPKNTDAFNVRFSHFVFFEPIDIDDIVISLPNQLQNNVKITSGGVGRRITPATWQKVLGIITSIRPSETSDILQLWDLVVSEDISILTSNLVKLGMQRDALGVCLDASGMEQSRRKILRMASEPADKDKKRSFLDFLQSQERQERHIIEHDANIIAAVAGNGNSVGVEYFSEGNKYLRVVVVDKGKFEHSLGIDLILYNENYSSLICVQYKCMEEEGQDWIYRPDEQFFRQLTIMKKSEAAFNSRLPLPEGYPKGFRLNTSSFYFKFCKRIIASRNGGELSKGMFMDVAHTELFLKSPQARGKRGGLVLGYGNCERYLNNSLFVTLLREGWIGVHGLNDDQLIETIENLCKQSNAIVFGQTWNDYR